MEWKPARRKVITAGLTAAAAGAAGPRAFAQAVRWSTGVERPKSPAPPHATDCHFHIYDSSFPVAGNATLKPAEASVEDYLALRRRIGFSRGVLVLPSTYGVDNRAYLELLPRLGGHAVMRMVGVVNTSVSDTELRHMHEAGVRGLRFNLSQVGATTLEMVEPLARRIEPMGWNCQINMAGADIVAAREVFLRVPGRLVFDHLAHIPEPEGVNGPAFALMRRLLDGGRTWIKLSGAYIDTKVGPPSYADSSRIAKAYVQHAPERLVWGSDWPHPTAPGDHKPDDARLFDLLWEWAPERETRHRILVDNPAELYDFPK